MLYKKNDYKKSLYKQKSIIKKYYKKQCYKKITDPPKRRHFALFSVSILLLLYGLVI